MGKMSLFLLVLMASCALLNTTSGFEDEGRGGDYGGGEWEGGGRGGELIAGVDWFLLRDSVPVIQTFAGSMRVVKGVGMRPFSQSRMHIGFITMEPNSLFLPQYLDSSITFFIRRGEARIGYIYEDRFVENKVKAGDLLTVEAGFTFYIVNIAEGQRLHIICSIDTSESIGWDLAGFQSFYVGGGINPTSVLSGFDPYTMAAALNVTIAESSEITSRQIGGGIVFLSNDTRAAPSDWSKFLDLEQHQRLAYLKRIMHFEEKSDQCEEKESRWSWRKLLLSVFGGENKKVDDRKTGKGPDSYNLFDRKPDFKNDNGWSKAVDESDYQPLGLSNIGVFLVYLSEGAMMAPHINPKAVEIGIVLEGNGTIEIVFPNGTLAIIAKVSAGDLFFVPKYFPFCQIASRTGSFLFFGFTTSSKKNWPQFLVGRDSIMSLMLGPVLAAAFDMPLERLKNISDAQRNSTILRVPFPVPEPEMTEKAETKIPKMIESFGNEMIMGFD